MAALPHDASPAQAAELLAGAFAALGTEVIAADAAGGRVLAEELRADRDSPACDVSAMDGYALAVADRAPTMRIQAVTAAGAAPVTLEPGTVVQVFTGAPVPVGSDAVIKREDVDERPQEIGVPTDLDLEPEQHIRRRGENGAAGALVCGPGRSIHASVAAALAGFGRTEVAVRRRVRVAVINTGDELQPASAASIEPWQIRDSNGPLLEALVRGTPWTELVATARGGDRPAELAALIGEHLAACDALLITGGVSVGDFDYVPEALAACGAETLFHGLPIRPGHPLLVARGPAGQAVFGLPGNPVSAGVTAVRFASIGLRAQAGLVAAGRPVVTLTEPPRPLHLWHYPLVELTGPGTGRLVVSRGSGDMVAAARSDGFVEVPPGTPGPGPHPWYDWAL